MELPVGCAARTLETLAEVKRDKLLDFENMSPAPKDIHMVFLCARLWGDCTTPFFSVVSVGVCWFVVTIDRRNPKQPPGHLGWC